MSKTLPFSQTLQAILVFTAAAAAASAGSASVGAQSAEPAKAAVQQGTTSCELSFTMKGWSAIVSKSQGQGVVTCSNGQSANVTLEIKGGGLTFGKTQIDEGKGVFSPVTDIADIFGSYAQAEASAGAVDSVGARALTKGNISLAITSKGQGWNLGVSGAKFTIERAAAK